MSCRREKQTQTSSSGSGLGISDAEVGTIGSRRGQIMEDLVRTDVVGGLGFIQYKKKTNGGF